MDTPLDACQTPRLYVVRGRDDGGSEWEDGRDMVDQYCAYLRMRHLSAATIRRRRECLSMFAHWIDPIPLERATAEHVEDFIGSRRAARTKHAYRSDLRSYYDWAVKKGHVDRSPAHDIPTIKVPKSLPRPIRVDEALGMLSFGSRRVRRMVGLALLAGLRCGEIARLLAEDVWLHSSPPTLVVRDGKGAKDRAVPMHPELVSLLRGLPASGPVFPGRAGPTVQPMSVSKAIRAHLAACKVSGTPHQLRHTFGTELARASNGNLVLCAEWMGHASTNTTMGYVRLAVAGGDVLRTMFGTPAA